MLFKKKVELSAYAAGKAATSLLIVSRYLSSQGEDNAASILLTVASSLTAGSALTVGKPVNGQPPYTEGLEPLIDLVEPIIKVVDALSPPRS